MFVPVLHKTSALHFVLLLGLQRHVGLIRVDGVSVLVVLGQHAALLIIGGHFDVVAGLGAAAAAHAREQDVDAVTRLGREREVDEGVKKGRSVNRPLHHRLVALTA